MGRAKAQGSRKATILRQHPNCCLCGGSVAATTVEHAPASTFFPNRDSVSGQGLVPACRRCNRGTSAIDLVASTYAKISSTVYRSDFDNREIVNQVVQILKRRPSAFDAIFGRAREAKDTLVGKHGLVHRAKEIPISPDLHRNWLEPWVAKMAYALYYRNQKKIAGPNARVVAHWLTSEQAFRSQLPGTLGDLLPLHGEHRQGCKTSHDYYHYKYNKIGSDMHLLIRLYNSSFAWASVLVEPDSIAGLANSKVFATSAQNGIYRLSSRGGVGSAIARPDR